MPGLFYKFSQWMVRAIGISLHSTPKNQKTDKNDFDLKTHGFCLLHDF